MFSVDVAYGVCSDISLLLSEKALEMRFDAGSDKFTNREVDQFKYHLLPLDRMIECRRPISEIIMFGMEINALLVSKCALLHRDFDAFNFSHLSDLLADEVFNVILLQSYSVKFKQLSAVILVDYV